MAWWADVQYYAVKVIGLASFAAAVAAVMACAEILIARLKSKRSKRA